MHTIPSPDSATPARLSLAITVRVARLMADVVLPLPHPHQLVCVLPVCRWTVRLYAAPSPATFVRTLIGFQPREGECLDKALHCLLNIAGAVGILDR